MRKLRYPSLVKLLFEQGDSPSKVDWSSDYTSFVNSLSTNASDPKTKAFLKAGKIDGDANDEVFKFAQTAIPVQNLQPTQNEIDVDGSLSYPMGDFATFKKYVMPSGALTIKAPVVTYNGKYVIDGHHRWSQLYACNPDAQINCLDIQLPGLNPLDVLKAVQASIAVAKGEVPKATVKGSNLLTLDEAGLNGWIEKNVNLAFYARLAADKEVLSTVKSKSGDLKEAPERDKPEADEASYQEAQKVVPKYMWSNVTKMRSTSQPVAGAPSRDVMPQTDDVDWQAALTTGDIDIKEPHADPSKITTESRIRDEAILERWSRLAGILKD